MGGAALLLAGTIAGHHGRLPDPDRLRRRIEAAERLVLPDWCDVPTITLPGRLTEPASRRNRPFRLQFLVRMLYGALTDADDRETAAFYDAIAHKETTRRPTELTEIMRSKFDRHMAAMTGGSDINVMRRQILAHARDVAQQSPGLFTLTVPTGGGKTLTSMAFGLDHALRHGLRRLIYVIPFTSIIEQTASVFREVLGDEAVLEHHTNADWAGEDESEEEQRSIMGASWDVPVVVTTSVQFFESLYAARKKRCRKLPAIAGSVVVLDEAQTLPLPLLRPCLAALSELIDGYGCSIVLSTATQPSLTAEGGFPAPEALTGAREIAPDPDALFNRLRRVEVRDVGEMSDAALAERMRSEPRALLIVDNRMQARMLFDAVRDAPGACHLSTLMTPSHRTAVLNEVRHRLKDGSPVRLISTSLIEAGVDVDFPVVLRAAAGIDAIAQAAGRCNREGKLPGVGRVEVFRPEHDPPPALEQFAEIGRKTLAEIGGGDPIGRDAVSLYFHKLWDTYGAAALDSRTVGTAVKTTGILNSIGAWGPECHFEKLEAAFRIIDDGQPTITVVDGHFGVDPDQLEKARYGSPGALARLLRPHTVNLPFKLWQQLRDTGLVEWFSPDRFGDQFALLIGTEHYDDRAGVAVSDLGVLGGVF